MPEFHLPSSPKGWVIALAAALVGLLSGGLTIIVLGKALR